MGGLQCIIAIRMMKTFALLLIMALAANAIPFPEDEVVPELYQGDSPTDYSDAKSRVESLMAVGKTDKDCREMAKTSKTAVEDAVSASQKTLDALKDGSQCKDEGQALVSTSKTALDDAKSKVTSSKKAHEDAKNADVDFGKRTLSSLDPGNCATFFSSPAYTDAVAKRDSAKAAAKAKAECLCTTKKEHEKTWEAATKDKDTQAKDWKQSHLLVCVLDHTSQSDCKIPATPVVKKPTIVAEAANADCSSSGLDNPNNYPTVSTDGFALQTCVQDCGTTSSGVKGNRVCDDTYTHVSDPKECPKWCKSKGTYSKFMLAWPTQSKTECWCCNTLDKADGGVDHEKLALSECAGGKKTSGLNGNSNGGCSGTPKGTFIKDGFLLGGWCTGAVYKLS